MTPNEGHLEAWDLDRLALDGLEPSARGSLEKHLGECASCARRWAEHREVARHFATTVFPRTLDAVLSRSATRRKKRWWLVLGLAAPSLAGVILLAAGAASRFGGQRAFEPGDTIGIKGDPSLQVFVLRASKVAEAGGAISRVAEGARLSAGDALRFVLPPAGRSYVMVVSMDGAGQPNVYYPFKGETSARIDGRASVAVPGSIVLDAAPGPERVFAIYSDGPLAAELVRAALIRTVAGGAAAIRTTRRLPLPGTTQATFLFEKDGAP